MYSRHILGVRVDFDLSMDEVIDIIENKMLKDGKTHYICTTNPEFIMMAQKDPTFKDIINNSDLSIPDGVGVILAEKYLSEISSIKRNILYPLRCFTTGLRLGVTAVGSSSLYRQRISGVDLVNRLCLESAKRNYSIFLLGGKLRNSMGKDIHSTTELSEEAANILKDKYPGFLPIGYTSKYFSIPDDDVKTIDYISNCMKKVNISWLDFLFVAYTQVNSEKWIIRNSQKIPARVSVAVGSTYEYITGHNMKIRSLLKSFNIEWLGRLLLEPFRWKRILNAFPLFPIKIFINSIKSQ